MIPKLAACAGCIAYSNSQYWVPDMYVPGSQVLVLQGEVSEYDVKGQIVTQRIGAGKYQAQAGEARPLNGPDGYDLKASYFQLAGLTAGGVVGDKGVSLASAVRCLTGLAGKAQQEAATYCRATHFHPPQSIELVVALGPVAAQAMGLEGKMEQWRGHVL